MVGFGNKKKKAAPLSPIAKGEVWWVDNLSFADNPGSKSRPVLIIGTNGEEMANIMEITSQPSSDYPQYELMDYLSAGLDHESYVKLRVRQISRRKLTRKMGRLVPADLEQIH